MTHERRHDTDATHVCPQSGGHRLSVGIYTYIYVYIYIHITHTQHDKYAHEQEITERADQLQCVATVEEKEGRETSNRPNGLSKCFFKDMTHTHLLYCQKRPNITSIPTNKRLMHLLSARSTAGNCSSAKRVNKKKPIACQKRPI